VRSQVKDVDTTSFGSSVEQEVWNPTDLGGSVGVEEASSLTWTLLVAPTTSGKSTSVG